MTTHNWSLAVDFGTSNTVAAVARDGQPAQLLSFPNSGHRLPSAVFLDLPGATGPKPTEGTTPDISVGVRAHHQARLDPTRFEAAPKRLLGHSRVRLGGLVLDPETLVAAVLRHVYTEAVRQQGGVAPQRLVVTHPADWADVRLQALHRSVDLVMADRAGAGPAPVVELLPEPVAAAWSVANHVAVGSRVAIFDVGGGTVDVALVDRLAGDGPAFAVVGQPRGLSDVGGNDLDLRLLKHVLEQLEPAARDRLTTTPDVTALLAALDLRENCRKAKEDLSEHPRSPVHVPPLPPELPTGANVSVSRDRFEELVSPMLHHAVDVLAEAVRASDRPVTEVLMVGGSSRIPALAAGVHAATGLYPADRGDPVAAVAVGAACWLSTSSAAVAPHGGARPAGPPPAPVAWPQDDFSSETLRAPVAAVAAAPPLARLPWAPPAPADPADWPGSGQAGSTTAGPLWKRPVAAAAATAAALVLGVVLRVAAASGTTTTPPPVPLPHAHAPPVPLPHAADLAPRDARRTGRTRHARELPRAQGPRLGLRGVRARGRGDRAGLLVLPRSVR